MNWNLIFEWIGRFALVFTFVGGFAVWFGKAYIDRWLARHFQGQLDNLKHVQAQEIERLRAKIAGMLDRATKLHHHEFEALSKSWDLLTTALGAVSMVTASGREVADPGTMSPEELEVFLAKTELEDFQKQAVRDADRFEKSKVYQTYQDRIAFAEAHRATMEFHNHTIQFGIFIEPTIRAKLTETSQGLQRGLRTWRQILDMPDIMPWPVTEAQAHVQEAAALSKEIDTLMTERLWSAAKLDV
ncbi:MAG TPA: hypothetical protein VGE54_05870 [Brevundimonas sp.]